MGKTPVIRFDNEFLPYHAPLIGEDEINEVIDTLRSGWLTMGPKTLAFEKQIAEYTGARKRYPAIPARQLSTFHCLQQISAPGMKLLPLLIHLLLREMS